MSVPPSWPPSRTPTPSCFPGRLPTWRRRRPDHLRSWRLHPAATPHLPPPLRRPSLSTHVIRHSVTAPSSADDGVRLDDTVGPQRRPGGDELHGGDIDLIEERLNRNDKAQAGKRLDLPVQR